MLDQISAGKYVNLSKLLSANLKHKDLEPRLLLEGHPVLTFESEEQRSLCNLFYGSGLVLSSPMEQFDAILFADPSNVYSLWRLSVACA